MIAIALAKGICARNEGVAMAPVVASAREEVLLEERLVHRWKVSRLADESCDNTMLTLTCKLLEVGFDAIDCFLPGGIPVTVHEGYEGSVVLSCQSGMRDASSTQRCGKFDCSAADNIDWL